MTGMQREDDGFTKTALGRKQTSAIGQKRTLAIFGVANVRQLQSLL